MLFLSYLLSQNLLFFIQPSIKGFVRDITYFLLESLIEGICLNIKQLLVTVVITSIKESWGINFIFIFRDDYINRIHTEKAIQEALTRQRQIFEEKCEMLIQAQSTSTLGTQNTHNR